MQAKMRCALAGQTEMRMSNSKGNAHALAKMICACAGQNEMRTRWPEQDTQAKMRCASAGQTAVRMRKPK